MGGEREEGRKGKRNINNKTHATGGESVTRSEQRDMHAPVSGGR